MIFFFLLNWNIMQYHYILFQNLSSLLDSKFLEGNRNPLPVQTPLKFLRISVFPIIGIDYHSTRVSAGTCSWDLTTWSSTIGLGNSGWKVPQQKRTSGCWTWANRVLRWLRRPMARWPATEIAWPEGPGKCLSLCMQHW